MSATPGVAGRIGRARTNRRERPGGGYLEPVISLAGRPHRERLERTTCGLGIDRVPLGDALDSVGDERGSQGHDQGAELLVAPRRRCAAGPVAGRRSARPTASGTVIVNPVAAPRAPRPGRCRRGAAGARASSTRRRRRRAPLRRAQAAIVPTHPVTGGGAIDRAMMGARRPAGTRHDPKSRGTLGPCPSRTQVSTAAGR